MEGTFTLPKALMKGNANLNDKIFEKKWCFLLLLAIDSEIAAPGVEQFYEKDEVLEHSYYQWVSNLW